MAALGMAAVCLGVAIVLAVSLFKRLETSQASKARAEAPQGINARIRNSDSDSEQMRAFDDEMERFLRKWDMKGASVAIMSGDSLLYAKGYGWADVGARRRMDASTVMRIASVSKLVTGVAVMKLVDMGKLRLSDRVFGPDGILNDREITAALHDTTYYNITVEHLLRHRGGFTNAGGDPMFSTPVIMQRYGLSAPPDNIELTRLIVGRRLRFRPGSGAYYSNFGYMLLSLVVEKVAGKDYESFVRDDVLAPAGITDFYLGATYKEELRPNETHYYLVHDAEPVEEYNGSGRMVERCYGGAHIGRLAGAGGWTCSVPELAMLVASIDGNPGLPDLLSAESVAAMTEDTEEGIALGWHRATAQGEWTRTGNLSSTCALVKRFADGQCWIMVTNTGSWRGPHFSQEINRFFERARARFGRQLPRRNLFRLASAEYSGK